MIELDWSRCRLKPFEHQKVGVKALIANRNFALFDEMGAGKTFQDIVTSCFLFDGGEVDTELVVCPASVRPVWLGDGGELAKHTFVPYAAHEYHSRTPTIRWQSGRLNYVITNYEFIREMKASEPNPRLWALVDQLQGRKVRITLDESSRVKNHKSGQSKACMILGKQPFTLRKTILNGTPISNNPLDLFSQFEFLDPAILNAQSFFHFRARYAVMGGRGRLAGKIIINWQNLEDLQQRIAPFALRRLKVDCLDLPEKIYTTRSIPLEDDAWRIYRQMRDDAVAYLPNEEISMAPQAIVKVLRLAQVTAGFIGGIEQQTDQLAFEGPPAANLAKPREVSRAKLKLLVELIGDLLAEDPGLRLIVWCRFRAELLRAFEELSSTFDSVDIRCIVGGQTRDERADAIQRINDRSHSRPVIVLGTPGSGGLGLTMVAADHMIYLSNDHNLTNRIQSEDRMHRPGQTRTCVYLDVLATGPDGQRTIDHVIADALRRKENLATMTAAAWRRELTA